jgi:hypothetical protein
VFRTVLHAVQYLVSTKYLISRAKYSENGSTFREGFSTSSWSSQTPEVMHKKKNSNSLYSVLN